MLLNVARSQKKPKMGGYVYSEITKVWYYLRGIKLPVMTVTWFLQKQIHVQFNKKIIFSFHMLGTRCLCAISKGN